MRNIKLRRYLFSGKRRFKRKFHFMMAIIKKLYSCLCYVTLFSVIIVPLHFILLWIHYENPIHPLFIPRVVNSVPDGNSLNFRILFWSQLFGLDFFMFSGLNPDLNNPFELNCSQEYKCDITVDRTQLSESHAVVFHLWDLDLDDLPEYKLKDQKIVLYDMEPPYKTGEEYKRRFQRFEHNIDWSMSYRINSDIYSPYADRIDSINTSYDDPKEVNRRHQMYLKKKRAAAWFVSNCKTLSKREDLVSELKKYFEIDMYGKCGPHVCKRNGSNCYQMVENNYMFYLSFENSVCQDYVTEKLFNILNFYTIPVVLGGADYSKILPNNSFIDVQSFKSPQDLADYLSKVSSDEKIYNSYFEWKRHTKFTVPDDYGLSYENQMCKLCRKLFLNQMNPEDKMNHHKKDMIDLWYRRSDCRSFKFTL